MTTLAIIVTLAFVCLLGALSFWAVVWFIKSSIERTKQFEEATSDPEVRSIILQLVRNQYYENPVSAQEKRSNSKRALAVIRLRRVVKDPKIRKCIYNLTDTEK